MSNFADDLAFAQKLATDFVCPGSGAPQTGCEYNTIKTLTAFALGVIRIVREQKEEK